jgi:hypothetical protein
MSDVSNSPSISVAGGSSKVYQGARDVRARAAVETPDDSPALRKSLHRLDQVLASGQPLRTLVPRGFYLNVKV